VWIGYASSRERCSAFDPRLYLMKIALKNFNIFSEGEEGRMIQIRMLSIKLMTIPRRPRRKPWKI
jgi:hypothetical protein